MSFSAGQVEASLVLDRTAFTTSLDAARRQVASFVRKPYEATLGAEPGEFEGDLRRVRRQGADFARTAFEAVLGSNERPFVRGLGRATVLGQKFGRERYEATAGLDVSEIPKKVALARTLVRNWQRSIGGRDARIGAEVELTGLRRFRTDMGSVRDEIRRTTNEFNRRMHTIRNAGVIAGRAAALGLIGSLGPASGAVLTVGAGLSAIAGGFGLISLAANETFRKVKVENGKIVADTGQTLTKSQQKLVDGLNNFAGSYVKAMQPANTVMNGILLRAARVGEQALPAIGKTAEQTAIEFSASIDRILGKAKQPRQIKIFKDFLKDVPGLTGTATDALGNFTLGVFNTLQPAMRPARQLFNYLEKMSEEFRIWSGSDRGRRQIREFLKDTLPVAQDFAVAAGKIAAGIFKLSKSEGALKLFDELATLGGTLGENLPKLEPTLKIIGRVIGGFNRLPKPLQNLAIQGAVTGVAFNALGGGFLVGLANGLLRILGVKGLRSAAGDLRVFADALKKLRGVQGTAPTTTGGPVPVGTAPATGPAVKRTWAGRLATLARGLAPVAIIATVTVVGLKKNIEYVKRDFGPKYGKALKETLRAPMSDAAIASRRDLVKALFSSPMMPVFLRWLEKPTLKAFDKWSGVVKRRSRGAGEAMRDGFRQGGIVGAASAFVSNWFRKTDKETRSKPWKPVGGSAAGRIAAGFATGGIIGGATQIIGAWFSKSKKASRDQAWKPLGSSAAGAILKGFTTGGLLGGAAALIGTWFTRSEREKDSKAWKPLGSSAAGDVLKGFENGGLIGGAIAFIGSWFKRTKAESGQRGWKSVGTTAAARIIKGFATGGVVGAIKGVIDNAAEAVGGKKEKFKGAGDDASKGFLEGWYSNSIQGRMVATIKGGVEAAEKWGEKGSPWRRTMRMGLDAGKGFSVGLDWSRRFVERSAKGLAESAVKGIRGGPSLEREFMELQKRAERAARRGNERGVEKARYEMDLNKARQVAQAQLRGADSPQERIVAMQKSAALAARAGDQDGVKRLRLAMERLKHHMLRSADEHRRQHRNTDRLARATRPHRSARDVATNPSSPGGGGQLTENGMRKIMLEANEKLVGGLLKAIRAEAARTAASPEFMRFLDSVIATDFNRRTDMKADAR